MKREAIMSTRETFTTWHKSRFAWVALIVVAATAGTVALVNSAGSEAKPVDLRTQIANRMRTTLEQADPGQHNHAGHTGQQVTATIICGVRVYGYEPAEATALADVQTVYGFHLCGIAEPQRPWDVAVKLAGPVIMDMSTRPPGIRVVEATAEVRFVDRLREMFPDKYAELALKEALTDAERADLRRRYDAAARL
jgi:hypothetical protein